MTVRLSGDGRRRPLAAVPRLRWWRCLQRPCPLASLQWSLNPQAALIEHDRTWHRGAAPTSQEFPR